MAEEAKLEQELIEQMKQAAMIQKKLEEMKRLNRLYEYKGPNIKIKLSISDKVFISSTKVLCNKTNGNTLFIRQIMGANDDGDETKIDNEGDESKDNSIKSQQNQPKMKGKDNKDDNSVTELFFDRDPSQFHLILNYLRGYNMDLQLSELSVIQLQSLLNDAVYYKIKGLIEIIDDRIHKRFDPRYCSPVVSIRKNGTAAFRENVDANLHHSCGVYGVLNKGKRYVEFQIISHGNRYIMMGITEAEGYSFAPYPGCTPRCTGISYYASNGHLYRLGSNEAWGSVLSYGDKCGILVDISEDGNTATVAFYVNGTLVKQAKNLKDYMDISKGVVFVANMHAHTEQVVIVQSPKIPN